MESSSPLPVRPLSVAGTPKRKREERSPDDSCQSHALRYSFESFLSQSAAAPSVAGTGAHTGTPLRDGSSSPRTRVAQRFGSLALSETETRGARPIPGDGYLPGRAASSGVGDSYGSRKRIRLKERTVPPPLPAQDADMSPSSSSSPTSSQPSSPPSPSSAASPSPDPPRVIVDPVRAALTWQDHEITVYDPDDTDDDGTGVNGVGFKPTPAIARARARKRRQQLADYRKREERDSRARRSVQRQTRAAKAEQEVRMAGAAAAAAAAEAAAQCQADAEARAATETQTASASAATPRRVRFVETAPTTICFIEPELAGSLSD